MSTTEGTKMGKAMQEPSWNSIVDYDTAVRYTGWSAADIDRMDTMTLDCKAAGAWDANERYWYVGYRSIITHRRSVRRLARKAVR
jgi:hypothetical protein